MRERTGPDDGYYLKWQLELCNTIHCNALDKGLLNNLQFVFMSNLFNGLLHFSACWRYEIY